MPAVLPDFYRILPEHVYAIDYKRISAYTRIIEDSSLRPRRGVEHIDSQALSGVFNVGSVIDYRRRREVKTHDVLKFKWAYRQTFCHDSWHVKKMSGDLLQLSS
jgi:hypothetical protein